VTVTLGSSTVSGSWNSSLAIGATGNAKASNVAFNGAVAASGSTSFDADADSDADSDWGEGVHGDLVDQQQLVERLPGWCDGQGRFGCDQCLDDDVHDLGNDDHELVERDVDQLGLDVHGEERIVERDARSRRDHELRLPGLGHSPDRDCGGDLHGKLIQVRGLDPAGMTD
jgi:hypothetical protein